MIFVTDFWNSLKWRYNKNLQVINADIVSNDDSLVAGVLADWVNAGTVENCYTSGKIENNNGTNFLVA